LELYIFRDQDDFDYYKQRADLYKQLEQDELVAKDVRAALKIQKCAEMEAMLIAVEHKIKTFDDYKLLGVHRHTPMDEIKRLHRIFLLEEHPDKHATSSSASENVLRGYKFDMKNNAYKRIRQSRSTILGRLSYCYNVLKNKFLSFVGKNNVYRN
jgi:hypothetical protein